MIFPLFQSSTQQHQQHHVYSDIKELCLPLLVCILEFLCVFLDMAAVAVHL